MSPPPQSVTFTGHFSFFGSPGRIYGIIIFVKIFSNKWVFEKHYAPHIFDLWPWRMTLTFHHSKCAAPWDTHACQISSILQKLWPRLKFWDRMTDRPKTIYPLFFKEGGIKKHWCKKLNYFSRLFNVALWKTNVSKWFKANFLLGVKNTQNCNLHASKCRILLQLKFKIPEDIFEKLPALLYAC